MYFVVRGRPLVSVKICATELFGIKKTQYKSICQVAENTLRKESVSDGISCFSVKSPEYLEGV